MRFLVQSRPRIALATKWWGRYQLQHPAYAWLQPKIRRPWVASCSHPCLRLRCIKDPACFLERFLLYRTTPRLDARLPLHCGQEIPLRLWIGSFTTGHTVPLSKGGWLAICTWNGHPYSCSVLSGGRYGCKRCKSNHRGDLRNSTAWEGLWSETGGKGQQGKRHASGSICSQLITFSCLYGILEQVGRHFEQKGECDDLQYGKVICQPCESRIDSHQGPASPFSPLVDLCILPARRTEACLETSSLSDGVAA